MPEIFVSAQKNILNPNAITFDERIEELDIQSENEQKLMEQAKKSPFTKWTQFNNEHTRELVMLALKYPKAHAILYLLIDAMDGLNACVCSHKVLQTWLDCSPATISRNVKVLKDLGFLAILRSGNVNVYTINDKVYWKSWGKNRQYSKFPANVILTMAEQDEMYKANFSDVEVGKVKEVKLRNAKK